MIISIFNHTIKNFTGLLVFALTLLLANTSHGQVDLQSSNLPIIIIDTQGQAIVDEPKVTGTLKIINNANGINNIDDVPNEYDAFLGIELRGQTSQFIFDKKSYGLELRDTFNADSAQSLFNMGKEEDWILHGPYSDKSLIRNYLTFYLWNKTGRYGSGVQLCEVIINNDYKGVYVFMEKIKRDDDRVDISRLNPDENSGDDLTGGYIIKLDKTNPGETNRSWQSAFRPPNRSFDQSIEFFIDYPKPENISNDQFEYIRSYVDSFEAALSGPNFKDPINGYRSFIDVEAFIDYSILTELNRNVDGYRLSTYLYKDKDSEGGKLVLGPPWDYNLAFGNANYCNGSNTSGWAWDFNDVCPEDFWLNPFWWERFHEDPAFRLQYKNRWETLRQGPFSIANVTLVIDSLATVLTQAQARNFQRHGVLNQWVWPNNFVGATYQDEINYLKTWVVDRLIWMDQEISTFSTVLGIEDDENLALSLFPIPSSNTLNVKSNRALKSYVVLNQLGQTIQSGSFAHPNENGINIKINASGIYILHTYFQDGSSIVRNFSINK